MRKLFIVGLVLLLPSTYPLVLMAREIATGYWVHSRYKTVPVFEDWRGHALPFETSIGMHTIRLEDDQPLNSDREARVPGHVRISVDGRDYSYPATVIIRPGFKDANRYWGFVHVLRLFDRSAGQEYVVISQNITGNHDERYRVLSVDNQGYVAEDVFPYRERGYPPRRKILIQYVSPRPIGFYSDLMQGWPSLFYPVMFPFVTGAVGTLFLGWGTLALRRRRNEESA